MNSDGRLRRVLRMACRALVLALAAGALGGALFVPYAGTFLIVNEPLEKSDAIFVLAGARVQRWLEGVDLYHEGWAERIVLSPGYSEPAEAVLRERGVRFPADIDLIRDAIVQLKVPDSALLVLPHEVDNTAQEASAIRRMSAERGWTRLIVVTSRYHTRRSRMAMRREFDGTPVRVIVRATRYDRSDAENWWKRRGDIRSVVAEYQKLILYRLGLRE